MIMQLKDEQPTFLDSTSPQNPAQLLPCCGLDQLPCPYLMAVCKQCMHLRVLTWHHTQAVDTLLDQSLSCALACVRRQLQGAWGCAATLFVLCGLHCTV